MAVEAKAPGIAPGEKVAQVAHGFMASSALNAVARLGVADELAAGPLSIEALAAKLKTRDDALLRVMRLLACLGIFEEQPERTFKNNDASECLRSDVENSQLETIRFICDPTHFQAYADMVPTLRDGRTAAVHVWGKGIFDVFESDRDAQARFDNAMTNMTRRMIPHVLEAYDFGQFETLVDVGGGHGLLLTDILQKHDGLNGVLFDMEHVVPGAAKRIEELGLTSRCKTASGDFFHSVPEGSAIIMKHIIHDWADSEAKQILENCRKAISASPDGKVILIEMVTAGHNECHPSKFLDVEMLVLAGGKERSQSEYESLLASAGLKLDRVVSTKGPYVIIEAVVA